MIKATGCHADWNKVLPAPRTMRRPRCSLSLRLPYIFALLAGWLTGWLALYCRLWTIIMYIPISKWDDPQAVVPAASRARDDSPRLNCIIEWCDLRALFISIYSLHPSLDMSQGYSSSLPSVIDASQSVLSWWLLGKSRLLPTTFQVSTA